MAVRSPDAGAIISSIREEDWSCLAAGWRPEGEPVQQRRFNLDRRN
jgi:hypothetical protein